MNASDYAEKPCVTRTNSSRLARAGAVILPPNPGFYHHPQRIDDLVDFVVARLLNQVGVAHSLMARWGDSGDGA